MQKSHLAKFNTGSCLRQFIKFTLDTSLTCLYININLKHFCHHFFLCNIVEYKVHLNEENRKGSLDSKGKSSVKEEQKDQKLYQIVEHYHFYN